MSTRNALEELGTTDADYGLTNAAVPPGASRITETEPVKKGDILIQFTPQIDVWSVKRVVKASRPEPSYGKTGYRQSTIVMVSHDAVPDEGKSGTAYSHYSRGAGWYDTSLSSISADRSSSEPPWYRLDLDAVGAREWIAKQDAAWAEHQAMVAAAEADAKETPAQFEWRMNNRAVQLETEAKQLEGMARILRGLADGIRAEKSGSWVK
jgi:hypothetical protein